MTQSVTLAIALAIIALLVFACVCVFWSDPESADESTDYFGDESGRDGLHGEDK